MPDLATLISQSSGSNQQHASDREPVLKLARASLDALVLRLGQTIDARVVGQLAAGLTQLSAGGESFVLKLEVPLPAGTAVTIRVTPTPQGPPAVTVSVPATPAQAAPLPLPTSAAPFVQAQSPLPAAVQVFSQATQSPLAQVGAAGSTARPGAVLTQPLPTPTVPVVQAAAPLAAQAGGAPAPPPTAIVPQTAQPSAMPAGPQVPPPATAPPTAQVPLSVPTPPVSLSPVRIAGQGPAATVSQPSPGPAAAPSPLPAPATMPAAAPPPVVTSMATPPPTAATPAFVAPSAQPAASAQPASVSTAPLAAQPKVLPSAASGYPVRVSQPATPVVARQLPLAAPRPAAPPLNLADPAQAAARQDSAAPLLAKLAMLVAATAPSMPRPLIEAAQRLLANRIDLNRAAPDGKALEAAVLKSGVVQTPTTRAAPADSKSALLALRSNLLAFLGSDGTAPVEPTARSAPPIKGEPPRVPTPQVAHPDPAADGHETARALLGHTDAALSRLKLLQAASQTPAEARMDAPAPRSELRVEIPMLMGAQTGILHLMVERDGKHKRDQERQRGWRMRFAMNFSETGEVGADIALLGRAASIAIWAADPETADALDEMLPELGPAIQRHGLELTSLRVRRGAPKSARTVPGRLLDSAR